MKRHSAPDVITPAKKAKAQLETESFVRKHPAEAEFAWEAFEHFYGPKVEAKL